MIWSSLSAKPAIAGNNLIIMAMSMMKKKYEQVKELTKCKKKKLKKTT